MFVLKRNQIIVTALVIMIAIAGYLNYMDRTTPTDSDLVLWTETDLTGALVPNEDHDTAILTEMEGEIGEAVSTDPTVVAIGEEGQTQETAAMPNDKVQETGAQGEEPQAGAAVFVNSSLDTPYFVQAKLNREQARAKQREWLTELINNKNLESDKRAEAADDMLGLQKRIEKESAAEAMIEAKGFSEVYVRIDDNTVDVVVNKPVLSEAELAQIEDIVTRKTGIEAGNIRISPLKN